MICWQEAKTWSTATSLWCGGGEVLSLLLISACEVGLQPTTAGRSTTMPATWRQTAELGFQCYWPKHSGGGIRQPPGCLPKGLENHAPHPPVPDPSSFINTPHPILLKRKQINRCPVARVYLPLSGAGSLKKLYFLTFNLKLSSNPGQERTHWCITSTIRSTNKIACSTFFFFFFSDRKHTSKLWCTINLKTKSNQLCTFQLQCNLD